MVIFWRLFFICRTPTYKRGNDREIPPGLRAESSNSARPPAPWSLLPPSPQLLVDSLRALQPPGLALGSNIKEGKKEFISDGRDRAAAERKREK